MEKGTRPLLNRGPLKGQEELQTTGLNYLGSTCLLWGKEDGVSLFGSFSHYTDNKCSPGLNLGPHFLQSSFTGFSLLSVMKLLLQPGYCKISVRLVTQN